MGVAKNVDMENLTHLDTLYYDLAAIYIIARQGKMVSHTIVPTKCKHLNPLLSYLQHPTSFFLRKDVETFISS